MATFEEKWENFKNSLKEHVPDWNTQFLNWADARGFGFGGGFFNEFPHTHTYETDLSWLISRMKWVLFRMDNVEARMKLVEDLLIDFVESLDINEIIRTELRRMIENGEIRSILMEAFNYYNTLPVLRMKFEENLDNSKRETNTADKADVELFRIDNMLAINILGSTIKQIVDYNTTSFNYTLNLETIRQNFGCRPVEGLKSVLGTLHARRLVSTSSEDTYKISAQMYTPPNSQDTVFQITVPVARSSQSTSFLPPFTYYFDERTTLYMPVINV